MSDDNVPAQSAPAPAPAPAQPVDPAPTYAVLTKGLALPKGLGNLVAGQVVFGSVAAVAALGDGARPATPAEISVSAPLHYSLES